MSNAENNKKILKGWVWIIFAFALLIAGSWAANAAFEAEESLIGWIGVAVAVFGFGFGIYKTIENNK